MPITSIGNQANSILCANCKTYAQQLKKSLFYSCEHEDPPLPDHFERYDASITVCSNCNEESIWYKDTLIYPKNGQAVAFEPGNVFDYFNETRKILALAKSEIFLIDPYVDDSIVSDYFAVIEPSVKVRILTSAKPGVLNSIIPAARKAEQQIGISIEIRSVNSNDHMHDRFWIIDGWKSFQSSSSVKEGGKKAAVIMEVRDILPTLKTTYEGFWNNGRAQLVTEPGETKGGFQP